MTNPEPFLKYTCDTIINSMLALQKLYDHMQENNVMITYKGEMTSSLVQSLLETLEPRIKCVEQDLKIRKKLYNILIECLQNILHHQEFDTPYNCSDHVTLLLVAQEEHAYTIRAGNMISNANIIKLKEWLDMVNSFPPNELRTLYKAVLNDGKFSSKGTAGLGFIDIARKSGQQLQYAFQKINERYSIFSFYITVPHTLSLN